MRVRSLAGMVVVAVIAAGCGSSASKATAPAAAVGAISVGGLGSSGPIGVIAVGSATQQVAADLAFVVVSTGSGVGGAISSSPPISFGPNGQPIFPTPTTAVAANSDAELSVYLPAIDPCKPDLSSSNFSVVSQLLSGAGSTSPSLSPIDATPSVTEHVSLSISRAMTS